MAVSIQRLCTQLIIGYAKVMVFTILLINALYTHKLNLHFTPTIGWYFSLKKRLDRRFLLI